MKIELIVHLITEYYNMPHSQDHLYQNPSNYENTENLPTYEEAMAIANSTTRASHTKPIHRFNRQQYNEDQDNASFTTEYVNQVNNILDIMTVAITLALLTTILSLIMWNLI